MDVQKSFDLKMEYRVSNSYEVSNAGVETDV